MANDELKYAALITKFKTEVFDYANGLVTHDMNNNPVSGDTTRQNSTNYKKLSVKETVGPHGFTLPTPASDKVTIAALAVVFQTYAYHLTRYRNVSFVVPITEGTPGVKTIKGVAPLWLQERMGINAFNNEVKKAPNPFDFIKPHTVVTEKAMDDFIARLKKVVKERIESNTIGMAVCHSSCHSSCHNNRGRR